MIAATANASSATDGPVCTPCPLPGSNCQDDKRSIRLNSLPLARGYWRTHNGSTELLPCPDRTKPWTGCVGGSNHEERCKPGLYGPYCQLCIDTTNSYYDDEDSVCVECGTEGLHPGASIGLFVFAAGVVIGIYACLRHRYRAALLRVQTGLRKLQTRLSLRARLKLLWSFTVIATNMPSVCAPLPSTNPPHTPVSCPLQH